MLCRTASCQHRVVPALLTGLNSVVGQRENIVLIPDLPWFTCDVNTEFMLAMGLAIARVR